MRAAFFITLWLAYLYGVSWYVHQGFSLLWAYNGWLAVASIPVILYAGIQITSRNWTEAKP